jgi:8-oxo-dGTP pyrophosphatase MutT (NUDIX family)
MYELVRRLNDADIKSLKPLLAYGQHVGYVRIALATQLLTQAPELFDCVDDGPLLLAQASGARDITLALAAIQLRLAKQGILPAPAPEVCDVRVSLKTSVLFQVNRNLVFPLGLKARGGHLVLRYENGDYLISQRSEKVFTSRGCYDVPVGGLLPAGVEPWCQMLREAEEEAGIPAEYLESCCEVPILSYVRDVQGTSSPGLEYQRAYPFETDGGTNWDECFCWSGRLPDHFKPAAMDGEVKRFLRMSPQELLRSLTLSPNNWKTNSGVMLLQNLSQVLATNDEGTAFDREGL